MQHQVTLPVAALKGAAHCAAKNSPRYYLNAVLVERTDSGKVLAVATDGGILAAQVIEQPGTAEIGAPFQCLLPLDAVKALPKSGDVVLTFSHEPGRAPRFSLDTGATEHGGLAVDGRFPDWRRVVPREASGEAAQFDADLLHRLQKAARTVLDSRSALLDLHHNGLNGTLVSVGEVDHWLAVIMPLRAIQSAPTAILAEAIAD